MTTSVAGPAGPRAGRRAVATPGGVLTGTVLVLVAVRLVLVVLLPYDRAVGLLDDDAWYYLGVARHVADGDGSTFSGLDPTNGYHPLWLLALVPVAAIAEGRGLLIGVTLLSAAVAVALAVLLGSLAARLARPWTGVVAALPLLVTGAAGPAFLFSGMETGLLLLGLVATAAVLVRGDALRAADPGARTAWTLGGLAAVTCLARLDAVLTFLVLGAVLVVRWRRHPRRVMAFAAPPAVALATYLVVNEALFGTPTPVSGQAKALGGDGLNVDVVAQFLRSPVVLGQQTWLGMLACLVVPAALLLGRRTDLAARAAAGAGATVLVGGLLTIAYYAVSSSWQLWPWYFSAAPLAVALAAPALLSQLPVSDRGGRSLAAAALVVAVLVPLATAARTAAGSVERSASVEAGPGLASQVDALEPSGALAMGDRAGSLGAHLARPMVHLEGLVGPPEYLTALQEGTVPAFLAAREVTLHARSGPPGEGEPAGPGCTRLAEPAQGAGPKVDAVVCDAGLLLTVPLSDGTVFRVWRAPAFS
ncbi:hypothetical protein ACI78R_11890 [Geodermatophilus sp. SYSU D01106]